MPTAYRLEVSPNNRAGCQNPECANEQIKLLKGEIRFGTWVEIPVGGEVRGSWKWRHWGCVTPAVVANLKQNCEDSTELIDGFDELPANVQQKVARALQQGHIDDGDWKGDEELNRPGKKGFRVKPVKKISKATSGDDSTLPAAKNSSEIPEGAENCLSGLSFSFIGTLNSMSRADAAALVEQYGAKVTQNPSGKTSYVIQGNGPSDKHVELVQLHSLKSLDEEGLFELIRKSPAGGPHSSAPAPKKRKTQVKEEDENNESIENGAPKKRKLNQKEPKSETGSEIKIPKRSKDIKQEDEDGKDDAKKVAEKAKPSNKKATKKDLDAQSDSKSSGKDRKPTQGARNRGKDAASAVSQEDETKFDHKTADMSKKDSRSFKEEPESLVGKAKAVSMHKKGRRKRKDQHEEHPGSATSRATRSQAVSKRK